MALLRGGRRGRQYPYEESFDTERGLSHIEGVRRQPPRGVPDEGYPFVLTTARPEEHYDTGTMSRRSPTLNRQHPENFVDIHPNDAERYGVADGDTAAATATAAGRRRRADSGRGP